MIVPYLRTLSISGLGLLTDPFTGFPPTPFLVNFSQLTPYLGTIMLGDPYSFILFYFLYTYCTISITLWGPTTDIQ